MGSLAIGPAFDFVLFKLQGLANHQDFPPVGAPCEPDVLLGIVRPTFEEVAQVGRLALGFHMGLLQPSHAICAVKTPQKNFSPLGGGPRANESLWDLSMK